MGRKIYVTAAEMLTMRENGMSNHDIAKALDISLPTVIRYIGRQDGRMEGLAAFRDAPPKKKDAMVQCEVDSKKYDPNPVLERYEIGGVQVDLNVKDQAVTIRMAYSGEVKLSFGSVPDLVQFLVWAMRERMEATSDEQTEQVQE